jgi:hypothetical protein
VGLSTVFVTVAAGLGLWLYAAYRERLKRDIFLHAREIGLLFERKEHLAFGAVLLCWAGAIAYLAEQRAEGASRVMFRTIALRAFVASAALAIIVAVMGTVVAVTKSF